MTNEVKELFDFINSGRMSVYSGGSSRAASSTAEERRITEVLNGLIVTRPTRKCSELSKQQTRNPGIRLRASSY